MMLYFSEEFTGPVVWKYTQLLPQEPPVADTSFVQTLAACVAN